MWPWSLPEGISENREVELLLEFSKRLSLAPGIEALALWLCRDPCSSTEIQGKRNTSAGML